MFIYPCSCFDCIVNKSYELEQKKLPQKFDYGGRNEWLLKDLTTFFLL